LARSAVVRLLAGDPLHDLPLARHNGRVDLRALWLVSARGLPGPRLAGDLEGVPAADGGAWADLDLSYATFRLDLAGMTVTNVLFDRADWQGSRVKASSLTDCSFLAADLRDSQFDLADTGATTVGLTQAPTATIGWRGPRLHRGAGRWCVASWRGIRR
jgi:hypothetical protein